MIKLELKLRLDSEWSGLRAGGPQPGRLGRRREQPGWWPAVNLPFSALNIFRNYAFVNLLSHYLE